MMLKKSIPLCIYAIFMGYIPWILAASDSESFVRLAYTQQTISGTVTDSQGQPLSGAAITIKDTNIGTVADFDGNYTIEVQPGATLVFSFLGFQSQEIQVGDQSKIDIALQEDASSLNEVVLTALNVKREEKSIGYATQQLEGDQIEEAKETNMVNALTGKIAGVQITNTNGGVGATSTIVLRGNKSLSGRNQPLFVIDGVPISNEVHQTTRVFNGPQNPNNSGFDGENSDASNAEQQVDFGNAAGEINPNDIESIQVLKGANAAALYGARAANGVILITTKKGKDQKGLGITVSSSITMQEPLKTPKFQTEFGKGDNGLYGFPNTNANAGKNFGPRFNGQIIPQYNPLNPNTPIERPWTNRLGKDPIGDFLETGLTQRYGVSITNGTEKSGLRLSYTRLDEKGMVPNTDLTRNSVSMNADFTPTDKFSFGGTANYINSGSDNRPSIGAKNNDNIIFTILRLGGNESLEELKNYLEPSRGETPQQATADRSVNNPYFLVNENLNGNERDRLFGNIYAQYDILPHLNMRVRTGLDLYSDRRTVRKAFSSVSYPNGFYSEAQVVYRENNSDILFTYDNKLGDSFSLQALLGANRLDQTIKEIRGSTGNDGLVTPGFYNLSNSAMVPVAQNFISRKRINSIYAGATLGYNGYLYLDLTARNDWSSTLPSDNNSYFYPSASLSAIVSEMVDLSAARLTYLKLRGSIAATGNDTDPYQTNPLTFSGGASNGITINSVQGNIGNPDLVPESITSIEAGIEASFFNRRIGFDVTYYRIKNEDQIVPIPLATESGFLSRTVNIPATITNKGVEVAVNTIPIKTENFQWNVDVNWSTNDNEISSDQDFERFTLAERWINIDIVNGGTFGDFFGDYLLRVDENGNLGREGLQIYRNDGRAEESDDVGSLVDEPKPLLGSGIPDWVGGIQNTFRYKDLSFSFLFDMNYGGEIHSRTFVVGNQLGALEESVTTFRRDDPAAAAGAAAAGNDVIPGEQWVRLEGATLDNNTGETQPTTIFARTSNVYRRYFDNDAVGTFDRTFVKLREVKLSYNLPTSLTRVLAIQSANVSIFGRNLMLWDNVPHIDPEAAGYSGEIPGGEFFAIPSARSFGMGLSVSF